MCKYPDDSREGRNIKEYLVSGVAYLRHAYPFQFDILFPWSYLALSKADPSLDITNLVKSNAFFDSFKYDTFLKVRDLSAWASCLAPHPAHELWGLKNILTLFDYAQTQ
ncbi:hypothetical protein DFP72DRAFT_844375 [Ephemerocybe angulata]|uniref:Uncharacterized protein n=1 Tax=Ephemerocybe angulata TaxID=980116 RepID=A0A8H6I5P4_9AGAR|nr:hypothetical protein DFP72DRAFT_844375 [Tulosesus angulatus]